MAPPPPAATIRRAAAWAQRKLPLRFTSRTWSQSASVIARKSTRGKTPALLTRIAARRARAPRRPPSPRRRCPETSPWTRHAAAPDRADLRGDPLGGLAVVQVVDADVGAILRERHRDGAADALLGARDERDLDHETHGILRSASPSAGPTRTVPQRSPAEKP